MALMERPPCSCGEAKALKWVTLACPVALVGVLLVGISVHSRWSVVPLVQVETHSCGRLLQYCLYFLFGICGFLYMTGDKSGLFHRIVLWGSIQVGPAWFLGFMAANLSRMNDGTGLGFVLFAPVLTLPSFLLALVLSYGLRGEFGMRSCLVARSLCLVVLLGIMGTLVGQYCCAESKAWQLESERRCHQTH